MTALDLDLVPEPPSPPAVMAARQRRALVAALGGGRHADAQVANSPFAERRLRATDTVSTRYVDPLPGVDGAASPDAGSCARPASDLADMPMARPASGALPATATPACATGSTCLAKTASEPASGLAGRSAAPSNVAMSTSAASATVRPSASAGATSGLRLDDALVVPAGALMRGYLRCHALLLVGDVVGNVHCTAGPVVIRAGASLKGRLVAAGDVYVCGIVGDGGGGAVITTRGKLTLAPGARVDGDVRSGRLDVYDGAVLNGVARRCED